MANEYESARSGSSRLIAIVTSAMLLVAMIVSCSSPPQGGSQGVQSHEALTIARANCGRGDNPENGLQGQATLAERFSAPRDYTCNLVEVGGFAGEGGSFHLARSDDCAYFSTNPDPSKGGPGTVVLDVSDVKHPRPTAYLTTPAMLRANESLEVDPNRKLLAASDFKGTTMEFYDVSRDCRRPVLESQIDLKDFTAHGGNFTSDGRTFFTANFTWNGIRASNAGVVAIDLSDPAHPRELARWQRPPGNWNTHTLTASADGNRVYLATLEAPVRMIVLDTSDVQARRPEPKIKTVSIMTMEGTSLGQYVTPVKIGEHPYVLFSAVRASLSGKASACPANWPGPPYASLRLIDMANEKAPKPAQYIQLEVNDPANCGKVGFDPTYVGYTNFQCDVDNPQDAKLLACSYGESGLRVFDIRDVHNPKELGYYKPRAWRTQIRTASFFGIFGTGFTTPAEEEARKTNVLTPMTNDHSADATIFARFVKNGSEIWFVSSDGGFHIVRFSAEFRRAHKDLF